ncbi:MAG: hypothetical protein FJ040_02730 [Chloroflexi bacterium]|nr:hypothetical protein [Chloroflexota bacterium]
MHVSLHRWSAFLISLFLISCTPAWQSVEIPAQPLYVVAGKRAIPGLDASAIWLLDRTTFAPTTQRDLPLTFIHDGFIDTQRIWLGYAGDLNEDAYDAATLSLDLRSAHTHRVCMEPISVHPFGDDVLVLCQERGFEGKVVRMRAETGEILQEQSLVTNFGDMMLLTSYLHNNELVIFGITRNDYQNQDEGCELQIIDPDTLTRKKCLTTQGHLVSPGGFLKIDDQTLYILNESSAYLESEQRPATDVFRYRTGDSVLTPLANFGRSPEMGTIHDGYLYTVHNIWDSYYLTEASMTRIYKTNLATWESTYWEYDFYEWRYIGDIATVDGHILLTRFGHDDVNQEGLYRLNTDTGELTMVVALPGVSLILMPKE